MSHEFLITGESSYLEDFKSDVLSGLSLPQKRIPSKYFYDHQGSYYFECICRCKEYYVTRTEIAIMKRFARDMSESIGDNCLVIEYGSGASIKTRLLFDHLIDPCAYIPIDIFPNYLKQTSIMFSEIYPHLEVLPLCADFTEHFEIPYPSREFKRKLIYFPGSTIGNFSYHEAVALLKNMHHYLESGDFLLLGIDLKKPRHILHAAYNDRQGYTASFNLNLLKRINRELQGDFLVSRFRHEAIYNERSSCMEMRLISLVNQDVTISGQHFYFRAGEYIHTESSYKYDLRAMEALTGSLGFNTKCVWTDPRKLFAVILLESSYVG